VVAVDAVELGVGWWCHMAVGGEVCGSVVIGPPPLSTWVGFLGVVGILWSPMVTLSIVGHGRAYLSEHLSEVAGDNIDCRWSCLGGRPGLWCATVASL
jgi:hypothetical protein